MPLAKEPAQSESSMHNCLTADAKMEAIRRPVAQRNGSGDCSEYPRNALDAFGQGQRLIEAGEAAARAQV
jgi:hypothetical protein